MRRLLALALVALVLPLAAAAAHEAPAWALTPGTTLRYASAREDGSGRTELSYELLSVDDGLARWYLHGEGEVLVDVQTREIREAPDADDVGDAFALWIPPVEEGARVRIGDVDHVVEVDETTGDLRALSGPRGAEDVWRYDPVTRLLQEAKLREGGGRTLTLLEIVPGEPLDLAAFRVLMYGLTLVEIGIVFLLYRRFAKRRAREATLAPVGYCPACGRPLFDAAPCGCGVSLGGRA